MSKNIPINIPPIPPGGDVENMRKQVTEQFNRMGTTLAKSDYRTAPLHLGGNRIAEVADPGAPTDAVNLRTLKKHLADLSQSVQNRNSNGGGSTRYSIVFSSIGSLVSGQTSAPYIVMPQRAGTPVVVKIACAASGTATATATFNVARNGVNIMAAPMTFPISTQGPVTYTNFANNAKFNVNDLITPVVSVAGGMAYVTIEVEVQP